MSESVVCKHVCACFYGGVWVCRDVWGVLYACAYVCVHVDTHPKCRDVCVCVCLCVCVGSITSGEEVLKNGSAMERGCGNFR